MKNSSMELKFTEDELLLQQLLHSDCVININSIEMQKVKKLKNGHFGTGMKGLFIALYCFMFVISLAVLLYFPITEQFMHVSYSNIPMKVTFYYAIVMFLVSCIFPLQIARNIPFILAKILRIIQAVIFIGVTFYFSITRKWECFSVFHLLAFLAFMLLLFILVEVFINTSEGINQYKNYVLLSVNSFMLMGFVFTEVFHTLRTALPDYTGGKLQGIMWIVFAGIVVLYYIGYFVFKLRCKEKEKI